MPPRPPPGKPPAVMLSAVSGAVSGVLPVAAAGRQGEASTTGVVRRLEPEPEPEPEGPSAEDVQRAKALAKMARMYLDDGNVLVAEQTVQKALELDPMCVDLTKLRVELRRATATEAEQKAEREMLALQKESEEGAGLPRLLTVIGASNLRKTDFFGGADPYAVVFFNSAKVGESDVQFKTTNPEWKAQFKLSVPPEEGGKLKVQIFDFDDNSGHDFLGQIEFNLGGARGQGGAEAVILEKRYNLMARRQFVGKDKVKGQITLAVEEDGLEDRLRALFWEIDEDGSGALDRSEIALLAGRLGKRLTESELTHAMLDMDIDGGGEVEFNEFFAWWKRSAGGGKGRNDGDGLKGLLSGISTAGGLMSKLRGNKNSAVAAAELAEGRRRKLVIVGASGLRNVDVWGTSDPYAIVYWDDERIGQTDVKNDDLNPTWNEDFSVVIPEEGGVMKIELYDYDDAGEHDFLGMITVDVGGKSGVGGEEAVFATQSWQLCNEQGTFIGVKGRVTVRIEEEGDMVDVEMRQLFREIDEDGSGTLDKAEVRQLVARLGKRLTDVQLQRAMEEMDPDGSGDVDFEEFKEWWTESARKKDSVLGSMLGASTASVGNFLSTLRMRKKELAEQEAATDPFKRKAMALYNHPAAHAPGHPAGKTVLNGTNSEEDVTFKLARAEVCAEAEKVRKIAAKRRARLERAAAWSQKFDILDEAMRKANGDPLYGAKQTITKKKVKTKLIYGVCPSCDKERWCIDNGDDGACYGGCNSGKRGAGTKEAQQEAAQNWVSVRQAVGHFSGIYLQQHQPVIFALGVKKEQLKRMIHESLQKSQGFSLGRIRDILKMLILAPIKVPWTWIGLMFKPYIKVDEGPLGMHGLRWLEARYVIRRWSLFLLIFGALAAAIIVPLRILINQCEACENPPFQKPLGGICYGPGNSTVVAYSEAECNYVGANVREWVDGVWMTQNRWQPAPATCLDGDGDAVDFMEKDDRITDLAYCELGNRERVRCEEACFAAGGSWTNPGGFCGFNFGRCALGDVTTEFRTISYANACPRNFDDTYSSCHRRVAYLERIHVSNMRGQVRVRVNHAVADKVTVDVYTEGASETTRNFISTEMALLDRVLNITTYWDRDGIAAGANGFGAEKDGFGEIELTNCPRAIVTVWLPNSTVISPPVLDIAFGNIEPFGWGDSAVEHFVPGLVAPLGEVDIDLDGASLAALRVFNPVGAVSVREMQSAQLTIDTAAGVGDVEVEDVTAAAIRIFAGRGSVTVANTRLQSPLMVCHQSAPTDPKVFDPYGCLIQRRNGYSGQVPLTARGYATVMPQPWGEVGNPLRGPAWSLDDAGRGRLSIDGGSGEISLDDVTGGDIDVSSTAASIVVGLPVPGYSCEGLDKVIRGDEQPEPEPELEDDASFPEQSQPPVGGGLAAGATVSMNSTNSTNTTNATSSAVAAGDVAIEPNAFGAHVGDSELCLDRRSLVMTLSSNFGAVDIVQQRTVTAERLQQQFAEQARLHELQTTTAPEPEPEPESTPEPEPESELAIDCDCVCDGDGVVNAVDTGRAGCFAHNSTFGDKTFCAVPLHCVAAAGLRGSTDEYAATASSQHPGTAWRFCNQSIELLTPFYCDTQSATARWSTLHRPLPSEPAAGAAPVGAVSDDAATLLDRVLPAWESWEATEDDGSGKARRAAFAARVHVLAGDGSCRGAGECVRATVPPTAGVERRPPVDVQRLEVFTQRMTLRSALGNVRVRMIEREVRETVTLRPLPPPPPPPGPNMTAYYEAQLAAQREAERLAEEAALAYLNRLLAG